MSSPVYRSYAESFRLSIYLPESGLAAPPTATYPADERLSGMMNGDRPPQSVLVDMAGHGCVRKITEAMDMMRGRAVPIIRFDSGETGAEIARFLDENHVGDVTLCVPYEKRLLLAEMRKRLPLSRGMLDLRGRVEPAFDDLVGQCQSHEATMLLVDGNVGRNQILRLRKRFIRVWVEEDGDLARAVLSGACGVLTRRIDALYDLLRRFPHGSEHRCVPLYAHKTYHVTGEYPENSVKGCEAAGRLGYDAAEIDVQLTGDDVMVIQHDRDTKNLFDANRVVHETVWEELKSLRRKAFPDDGLDTMEELMEKMAGYPETPVLIEIKTPSDTYGVEEMVRQLKELLRRGDVQKSCTLIMGVMPPYLSYVHAQIPEIPTAHCTWVQTETATENEDENNLRLYRFALETRGANAGFNPYHPMVGRAFARLAHARGITVFPWTWAFETWEDGGEAITDSYLQGHDGLTSDWVGKFYDVPVDVRASVQKQMEGREAPLIVIETLDRCGRWKKAEENTEVILLDDGENEKGTRRFAVGVWTELEAGRRVCMVSRAYEAAFG